MSSTTVTDWTREETVSGIIELVRTERLLQE